MSRGKSSDSEQDGVVFSEDEYSLPDGSTLQTRNFTPEYIVSF